MARQSSPLAVSVAAAGAAQVVTVKGVLDGTTYRSLRDQIIKAALDEPIAVIVDVDALEVPAPSAWAVFTSAHWHVTTWPAVPIMLVSTNAAVRATIARNGVARYVPVHPGMEAALSSALSADGRKGRLRARAQLPAASDSPHRARQLMAEWLTDWSKAELIPVAKIIVDVLVENVLEHTDSAPVLVMETDGTTVTVTVQDGSSRPAAIHENPAGGTDRVSGLVVLDALCRVWGSMPTPSGKTVWAVIGPENRL